MIVKPWNFESDTVERWIPSLLIAIFRFVAVKSHGPAITLYITNIDDGTKYSVDLTLAIKFVDWPDAAIEWITRRPGRCLGFSRGKHSLRNLPWQKVSWWIPYRFICVLSSVISLLGSYVGLIHCSYKKFLKVVVILLQNSQKESTFLTMRMEFSGDFLSQQLKRSCFFKEAMVKPALAANRF